MTLHLSKHRSEILREAIRKVEARTDLTATGPGSILRALIEAITSEIGDLYDAMDFNISQATLGEASGRALDLIGSLYGLERRKLSDLAATSQASGAFYFYLTSPYGSDITIPAGTRVYSSANGFVGRQFSFETTQDVTIPAGQLYAYAGIKPKFADSAYTAGIGTLTSHDFVAPVGATVLCKNVKPIAPQIGYELDEDFRTRIIKSIRVSSSGTAEAVRFKALSFNGVRDARIINNKFGLGSFKLLIIPENPLYGQQLVRRIVGEIEKVAPVGVTMLVGLPDTLPIDVSMKLILKDGLQDSMKKVIVARVENIVTRYLNDLLPGRPIVYNRMVSLALSASSDILDVQVTTFAANGVELARKNFTPKEEELITPASINVST